MYYVLTQIHNILFFYYDTFLKVIFIIVFPSSHKLASIQDFTLLCPMLYLAKLLPSQYVRSSRKNIFSENLIFAFYSYNRLTELVITGLHYHLSKLDLSSNNISSVRGLRLDGLVHLSEINLSNNKLISLPPNSFSTSGMLRYLLYETLRTTDLYSFIWSNLSHTFVRIVWHLLQLD